MHIAFVRIASVHVALLLTNEIDASSNDEPTGSVRAERLTL
jgi:hypothetical protein